MWSITLNKSIQWKETVEQFALDKMTLSNIKCTYEVIILTSSKAQQDLYFDRGRHNYTIKIPRYKHLGPGKGPGSSFEHFQLVTLAPMMQHNML